VTKEIVLSALCQSVQIVTMFHSLSSLRQSVEVGVFRRRMGHFERKFQTEGAYRQHFDQLIWKVHSTELKYISAEGHADVKSTSHWRI